MNYLRYLSLILVCLLSVGVAQAAVTHYVQQSGAYTIEIFNGSAGGTTTWTPPEGVDSVDYLVVAGGGGGGHSYGGGGGAGGLKTGTETITNMGGSPLTITVGAGGASPDGYTLPVSGVNGSNSSIGTNANQLSHGGGGGSGRGHTSVGGSDASSGGSGGGANAGGYGGYGAPPIGAEGNYGGDYAGWQSGGGGGYGSVGNTNGNGGAGTTLSGTTTTIFGITDNNGYLAGGGGSAANANGGTAGTGGSSIGGAGATSSGTDAPAGIANTGSGGGGGYGTNYEIAGMNGGAGGSGIVIIRYSSTSPPVASFSSTNISVATNSTAQGYTGEAPFTMQFTNTSNFVPTSYVWNYTALGSSTAVTFNQTAYYNPIYTFTNQGNYSIQLNATGSSGTNISTQVTWVNVTNNRIPIADFTANSTGGAVPLTVLFTDTSTIRPKVWNWSVNASDWSSRTWYNYTTSTNLVYTFSSMGLYNVTLSVQNTTEETTITTKSMDILVNNSVLASFVGAPRTGFAPQTVYFVDFSSGSGLYGWNWSFGDGSYSTTRNPSHAYSTAGSYTISLRATGTDGTNTNITPNYIVIGTGNIFTANKTSHNTYGFPVLFSDDQASGHNAWNWSFGDTYLSALQAPTHYYSVAGKYSVTLNVTDPMGYNQSTLTNYINLSSDLPGVVSWMHMNGNNDGTTFADLMGSAWSPTQVTTSTATKKYGSASAAFQQDTSKLVTPSSTLFNLGAGDFTIEMWVYPTSTGTRSMLVSRTNNALSQGWGIYNGAGSASDDWHFFGGSTATQTPAFTIPLNTWTHVVAERESGTVTIYLNGIAATNAVLNGNYDTTNTIKFGDAGAGTRSARMYVDEPRISNVKRWSPFDPPYAEYTGDLYPLYPDVNPGSTVKFSDRDTWILNTTPRIITAQIQNVNITNNISIVTIFEPTHLFVSEVTANTTHWAGINFTRVAIDNTIGTIQINATRPGGFSTTALDDNTGSFADIRSVFWNYSAAHDADYESDEIQFFGAGYLKNSSTGAEYPIHNFERSNMSLIDWVTYGNFTANTTTAYIGETYVGFFPELNYTANRWYWDWGDGTTLVTALPAVTHMYTVQHGGLGAYTSVNVSMTAYLWQNNSVTNTTTRIGYITPKHPLNFTYAAFSANPTSSGRGVSVAFTDLSEWGETNANSGRTYNWSFGDLGTSNVVGNVNHVYTDYGIYTVKLVINNTLNGDMEEKINYITISESPVRQISYVAHLVRLRALDYSGRPIPDMTITAQGIEQTAEDDWIGGLLGVNLGSVPIQTDVMSGTTDDMGSISFMMLEVVKYRLTFTKAASSISETNYLYPQGTDYTYTFWTESPYIPASTKIKLAFWNAVNTTDPTMMDLGVSYTDVDATTDKLMFKVVDIDDNIVYNLTQTGVGTWNGSHTVLIERGVSYSWLIWGNSTRYDKPITQVNQIAFGGSPVIPFSLGNDTWNNWAAIIIIFVTATLFGRASLKYAMAVVPLLALFFSEYGIKWLQTPGLVISVAVFFGILFYIRYAEQETDV
jgi:PKD repeat protein